MTLVVATSAIVVVALAAVGFGPTVVDRLRHRRRRRRRPAPPTPAFDPGRERRAEARARELLRSVVGEEIYAMYRDLGFIGPHRGRSLALLKAKPLV